MQIYEKLERVVVMFTGGIKSTALLDFIAKNKDKVKKLNERCQNQIENNQTTIYSHENL